MMVFSRTTTELHTVREFWSYTQGRADAVMPTPLKPVHRFTLTILALAILGIAASIGPLAILLALPLFLVALAIAGGMRRFSKIPLRDEILYILISLAIVGIILGVAIYDNPVGRYAQWITLVLTAAFVFGYLGKEFWKSRRSSRFWPTMGTLLTAHCVLVLVLFNRTSDAWKFSLPMALAELFVGHVVLDILLSPKPPSEPLA